MLCYGSARVELVGTLISYDALGHGVRRTRDALRLTADDRLLSWLPPDHYTGLMNLVTVLAIGGTAVLMPPREFARDPLAWLHLVDRHRVTVSGAAPAAYARCVAAAAQRPVDGIDLSSWRIAYTSPVALEHPVLTAFAEAAAPFGFDPAALCVAYCLPEATFLVTSSEPGVQPRAVRVSRSALEKNTLVESAHPDGPVLIGAGRVDHLDVRVVDPDSARALPDRRVGEVWLRVGGLALGYWRQDAETARSFGATLDNGETGFFRTGDLGVLDDGELYVLGGADGMLSVSGRTLRALDLERELAELFRGWAGTGRACSPSPCRTRRSSWCRRPTTTTPTS
ncbi:MULTISPECIES: AMP-binding protein [Saccharothrix]|uniref:AMP-binding protein n=1 Tax=Saccharothrix TaxID=2071 RepID=UPI00093FA1E8|nr:AMP-binding protein [Saccharothrix sp. CB00851]OKI26971.1 hypothetical protein A6A25_06930 [Saccharothrix sp. CB00851]